MLLQGANFGLGVWKLNGMGLLPTATSDWLAYMEPKEVFSLNYLGFRVFIWRKVLGLIIDEYDGQAINFIY